MRPNCSLTQDRLIFHFPPENKPSPGTVLPSSEWLSWRPLGDEARRGICDGAGCAVGSVNPRARLAFLGRGILMSCEKKQRGLFL